MQALVALKCFFLWIYANYQILYAYNYVCI